MTFDGKGIALVLALLAMIGFAVGAVASIWFGPMAMLWGALGVPLVIGALILIVLIFTMFPDGGAT